METLNTLLIIDLVIIAAGVYFLYLSFKMHKTHKVESFIIPEEILKQCKDETAFAQFLAIRQMIFSIIMIVCGTLMAIHETVMSLGIGHYVVTGILVVALIVFYSELSDGRNRYC